MAIMLLKTSLTVVLLLATTVSALNASCAPGGNFDLTIWDLQLPIGQTGDPETITATGLENCNGFQDQYFFTESVDGALVMTVPGSPASSGCVTTANSLHCRTELRETSPSSWDPNGPVNRLSATLQVIEPDNSAYGTVVGQIHIEDSVSSKPACELYYNSAGWATMGVEQTIEGGDEIYTQLGHVPVGEMFSYEIRWENNVLSASINGNTTVLDTYSLDAPPCYFKAGNYNQGNSSSEVHFFSIVVSHNASTSSTTSQSVPPPASTTITAPTSSMASTTTTAPTSSVTTTTIAAPTSSIAPTTSTSTSTSSSTCPPFGTLTVTVIITSTAALLSSSVAKSTSIPITSTTSTTASASPTSGGATAPHWGQCGGTGWTGPTICASPYTCTYSNAWYSQCL